MAHLSISIFVVLISLFGPFVINVNLTSLHSLLNFEKNTSEIERYARLKTIIEDPEYWVHALIDHSTQLHVALIAWFALYINVAMLCGTFLYLHSLSELIGVVGKSIPLFIFVVFIVLLLFVGGILFVFGDLSTPKLIALYKPEILPVKRKFPPYNSTITWLRGTILACGGYLFYLEYVL